jgi:hypothetical protein
MHNTWQRLLLIIAAVCSIALPNVVMARQAADGELLRVICTAEGKKAIGGAHSGHDCMQCCSGTAGAPPTQPSTNCESSFTQAAPTQALPTAAFYAVYLTPAATGPPRAL